jgi:transposase
MNATTYGLDVAKRVFQIYWVDADTGEIVNRRFGRDDLIQYLSQRPPGRVALEACGSAHWWARKIKALGHDVVLLHAKFIRPCVQTNKTDAADALAIWTAVQQPGIRIVAAIDSALKQFQAAYFTNGSWKKVLIRSGLVCNAVM